MRVLMYSFPDLGVSTGLVSSQVHELCVASPLRADLRACQRLATLRTTPASSSSMCMQRIGLAAVTHAPSY